MINSKRIRIALFADVLEENLDGVTKTLHKVLQHINRAQFEFLLITSLPSKKLVQKKFKSLSIPSVALPLQNKYPICLPWFSIELRDALDKFKPDLIHFTTPFTLGSYAITYGKRNNIPILSTYHTHFVSYVNYYLANSKKTARWARHSLSLFLETVYQKCDRILVPTQPLKEELQFLGLDSESMSVWGRGIDHAFFTPIITSKKKAEKFKVLFVSRLVWEKNLRCLIDLQQNYLNELYELHIVGDGPALNALQKEIPTAIFHGKLVADKLVSIYQDCDAFVFPSASETFGNVVLEALSCGLPVIAANRGGPKGILKAAKTGFLVPPNDTAAYFEHLEKLRTQPKLYSKLKQDGRVFAVKQDWSSLCAELEEHYEEVIKMRKSRRPTG